MKNTLCRLALASLGIAALCASTLAHDPALNELYLSHTGNDDQEFVEIVWDSSAIFNGHMLLVVEGDAPGEGILDQAIDLTGMSVSPTDVYFVLGTSAVANLDLDLGSDNVFENGTQTIYLIQCSLPTHVPTILGLVGTDLDADDDLVTDLASLPFVFIKDLVALTDGDAGDQVFDGAPTFGPDGAAFPAGILRGFDSPNAWCTDSFLDFNLTADRTPGTMNIDCPVVEPGAGFCDGSAGNCPCAAAGASGHGCPNSNPNGNGARLVGAGSASFSSDSLLFSISDGPSIKPGILIQGPSALNYPNGTPNVPNASGIFCVNPALRGGVFFTDASGAAMVTDFQGMPFGATAQPVGSTSYYQYWFRDPPNACQNPPASAAAFNFSNGYEIDWQS